MRGLRLSHAALSGKRLYLYKATEDYPPPLTVYRPLLPCPYQFGGRAEEELTLPVVTCHPAAEASKKELNGRIYNEAVEVKDCAVDGVKAQTLVTAEEPPEGAVYLRGRKGNPAGRPRADQKGEFPDQGCGRMTVSPPGIWND